MITSLFAAILVSANVASTAFLCLTSGEEAAPRQRAASLRVGGHEFRRVHAWVGLSLSLTGWILLGGAEIGISIWLGLVMASGGAAVFLKPRLMPTEAGRRR